MAADTFPYWPANFMQRPYTIAGRQALAGLLNVSRDCRIPPSNGMTHDVNVIPFINVGTAVIDAKAVAGFRPISGRGQGAGLMDLMLYSVQNTGGREVKT